MPKNQLEDIEDPVEEEEVVDGYLLNVSEDTDIGVDAEKEVSLDADLVDAGAKDQEDWPEDKEKPENVIDVEANIDAEEDFADVSVEEEEYFIHVNAEELEFVEKSWEENSVEIKLDAENSKSETSIDLKSIVLEKVEEPDVTEEDFAGVKNKEEEELPDTKEEETVASKEEENT